MTNIDRIEELMSKHYIDAIGQGDEHGHYNGIYEIDADHLLEILEQAEKAARYETVIKHLKNTSNEFKTDDKQFEWTCGFAAAVDFIDENFYWEDDSE